MSLSTILLLGSVQAAFLVVLILTKRGKTLPDWILASWVGLLGTHHLLFVLFERGVLPSSAWLNLNAGVPLLQGPLLYLYVETLTSGRKRMRATDLLHLIPFALFAAFVLLLLPRSIHGEAQVSIFRLSTLLTATILVSVPAYSVAALIRLRRYRLEMPTRHSETRGRDLLWLRWIVLALLGVWAVVIAVVATEYVAPGADHGERWHPMMSAVTLFIYVIGYFGFRQIAVSEPDEPPPQPAPTSPNTKYERSGLSDDASDALLERLTRYLDEEKPYLEEGLTLRQVADGIGLKPNQLSQIINQRLGMNFYQAINERRVAEFQRRVADPQNRSFTLLAIALDSGFSSKSSFNRVFKQFTGMSPKQFADGLATQAR